MFFGTQLTVSAQNWQLKVSADFNLYFTDSVKTLLPIYDSIFRIELAKLQKQLNYHVNQPIDVFITEQISTAKTFSLPNQIQVKGSGGIISMESKPVVLLTTMGFAEVKKEFRKGTATVLLDEMMNGGTLQDKVRNANLIHLPDWVIPGLVHFLGDEWSLETDNAWRVIHDEIGLKRFNAIPNNKLHIKGAAMWKYITYKYGDNAIQTILYMARLTRKFNAALFYAYQVSMYDIYTGALDFYERGYEIDQQKANPINGISYNADDLLDICIKNQALYYTLEHNLSGVAVYKIVPQTATKLKLYSLSLEELPSKKFSGSIQLVGDEVSVFINTAQGVICRSSIDDFKTKKKVNIPSFNQCIFAAGQFYFLLSNLEVSQIVSWDGKVTRKKMQIDGYAESFDLRNGLVVFSTVQNATCGINIISLNNKVMQKVSLNNEFIKQVRWANDSVVLFNSSKNGIWNGRLYNLKANKIRNVTNYRSNIGFHYYSDEVFAEFLNRGEYSSLYLADYIPTNEFYSYDSLIPAYFSQVLYSNDDETEISTKPSIDSLENYSFQSPINKSFDFSLSNYDSLLKVEAKKNKLVEGNVLAPNIYKPHKLAIKINNDLLINNQTAFISQVPTLTPNNVTIRLATIFKNQFNNRELSIAYNGIIQQGAQDIGLIYSKRKTFQNQLTALHRQRLLFQNDTRQRFSTDLLAYSINKKLSRPLAVRVQTSIRSDRRSTLAIDKESLITPNTHQLFASMCVEAQYNLSNSNSQFHSELIIIPQYSILQRGFNTTINLDIDYDLQPATWVSINLKGLAGTSVGSLPNVFMLGGLQNDVLANYYKRDLGNNVQTSLINLIYNLRGFDVNYRNGTSFGLLNLEAPIKVLDVAFARPITSEVFGHFRVIPFLDLATSFYGRSIYDTKNNLNKEIISSSTGTIVAEVNAFKNPFVYATGLGFATQVYNYNVRIDLAFGLEEGNVVNRMGHLSFGFAL